MKQLLTKGIVLNRTNYGEADRIITVLTPDYGKLRLMARGVRKVKSKLAGGVELFTVSEIGFIQGRGEVGTLISARLSRHYGHIVNDISRVQAGYELIKLINKSTEDQVEAAYFKLLDQGLAAIDDFEIELELTRSWFAAQLIKIAGHSPNLSLDSQRNSLKIDQSYGFDFEEMAFAPNSKGRYKAEHIKCLRLLFGTYKPADIQRVDGVMARLPDITPLIETMLSSFVRV